MQAPPPPSKPASQQNQGMYGQRTMPPMQQQPLPQMQPQQQQQMNRSQVQQPVLDPAAQCDKAWLDPTLSKFPTSDALSEQSALPLGCILQPLAEHPDGKEPPVVNFGSVGVVRCRACRAYINPFVIWLENGRRWKCNLCNRDNETSTLYYSHLDANGQRADRMEHPELSQGCIEIMAPSEYMVRPPQAPVYFFVIDVSFEAVQSGMLATAVKAIQECLDKLPGAPRTQVGFITYDYAVHYYSLNSNLSQPKMFVVSDLDELFLPCPEDLLVNLADSREVVDMLLDSLPRIHSKSQTHDIASGSAIQAAYRVMVHIGGKMIVFQSKLPTLGKGKLAHRENVRLLGTDKEHTLFQPADAFYQNTVSEMGKNQVSIELFLTPTAYCDAASLHSLAKSTGGQLHFFPRFTSQRHGQAFAEDVKRTLTREIAWEAVLRLRASHGVRVTGFHGNFQLRGNDLMQLPTCDADATYALEFRHQEKMVTSGVVTLQGALLYTNSNGQRRIRVLTTVLPVTSTVSDLHASANQDAIAAFISKKASTEAFLMALPQIRSKMQNFCVNVLRASKSSMNSMPYGQPPGMMMPQQQYQQQQQQQQQQGPQLPESMSLLPLYAMAMIKSPAFRGGDHVGFDERINFLHAVNRMSRANCALFLYPRLYEMHSMTPDCGRPVAVPANNQDAPLEAGTLRFGENQRIKLPRLVNLSAGSLNSSGVFLLDNGLELMLWVGRGVDPRLVQALFGVPTLDGIDGGVLRVERQPDDNDMKQRICNIIDGLRGSCKGTFQQIQVIKEGDPLEIRFRWFLVEDRASFTGGSFSYDEFIGNCQRLSLQAPQR
ncbi:Protein transport protein SEC24 [Hondaea fermentalgiana]|uniref:Protein transport protein SEC24 n=1 Tax=Hondaea fermentalgiana TaxID=2315210 RepID=A0A2R5GBU9_9STRA|nr:Protein transport protein SEC24 [Hondaea fermentalgiana]|eukprot:GBG28457.1 Protein transport protein SEC24 [Hondaea fermentalgiana]